MSDEQLQRKSTFYVWFVNFGGGGSKNFFIPPEKLLVCGGSKNLFIPPQNCKTESAKFHEILTSVCVGRGLKTFLYPPKIVSVCVWGGLKTETGKLLLHFQNSKSSNRCRSVYGTDIIIPKHNSKICTQEKVSSDQRNNAQNIKIQNV